MRRNLVVRGATLLGALLLILAPRAAAQDAAAILQAALDRYEQRVEGIDDYTVTYSFMGRQHSTHMRKQIIDGNPVFVPVDADDEQRRQWESPYRLFPELAERARVVGTETIDGVPARALRIDDLEGLELDLNSGMQGEFEARALTLWIGTREQLVRKMNVEGVGSTNGQERPMEITAWMRDYRSVEGMPYPFRTEIRTKGLMGAGGASEEEAAEARERLEELDRRMAQLSPSQREMMEKAMGVQLEQLRQMAGSGELRIELQVSDLVVNAGPPAES